MMAILDSAFDFCVPASLGFALNFFVFFEIRSPSTQRSVDDVIIRQIDPRVIPIRNSIMLVLDGVVM